MNIIYFIIILIIIFLLIAFSLKTNEFFSEDTLECKSGYDMDSCNINPKCMFTGCVPTKSSYASFCPNFTNKITCENEKCRWIGCEKRDKLIFY